MKKYETPSIEVEYFTMTSDVISTSSGENPDNGFGDPTNPYEPGEF